MRRVREAKQRAISMLKSDHFLADANWEMVDRSTEVEDPYKDTVEAVQVRRHGEGEREREREKRERERGGERVTLEETNEI